MIFLWLALGCGEAAPPHQPSGLELYPQCADLSDCQGKYAQAVADKNDIFAGLYAYDSCNYGDEDLCLVYAANAAGPVTKGGILDELCRKYPRKLCVAAGEFRAESGWYDVALEYYKIGCDAGYLPACDAAAQLGSDYVMYRPSARDIAAKGCSAGSNPSCKSLARWDPDERDPSLELLPVFKSGCAAGSLNACVAEGNVYYFHTDPTDRDTAMALYKRACDGGAVAGCSAIARTLGREDPERWGEAYDLSKRACDSADVLGCRLVAVFALSGKIATPDDAYAFAAAKMACADGDWTACEKAAVGIDLGRFAGTAIEAVDFRKRACDHGYAKSCRP